MTSTLKSRAATLTMVIDQGADFNPYLPWKDSSGSYFNLTGYTGTITIKDASTGATIDTWTSGADEIVFGTGDTNIQIVIADTVTADYDFTTANYDFFIIDTLGDKRLLLTGQMTLNRSV